MHPMLGLNDSLFVAMTVSTRIIGMHWWSIGMGLKRKKHGKEPNRFTFFKLTHTCGENEISVEEASRLTIIEFNKRIEERIVYLF
ncbi:unnamed protein product [Prunus brigantina]